MLLAMRAFHSDVHGFGLWEHANIAGNAPWQRFLGGGFVVEMRMALKITPLKTNMDDDTKIVFKISPFKKWLFWVSMLVFGGVTSH